MLRPLPTQPGLPRSAASRSREHSVARSPRFHSAAQFDPIEQGSPSPAQCPDSSKLIARVGGLCGPHVRLLVELLQSALSDLQCAERRRAPRSQRDAQVGRRGGAARLAEPRLHRAKHDNASPTLGGDNAHATYDEDPANASAMVAHGCRRPNGDDQRFRRCAGQVVGPGEYRNEYGMRADPWERVLELLRESAPRSWSRRRDSRGRRCTRCCAGQAAPQKWGEV